MINRNSGFIALFSVIIISTVLLLAAVSSNFSGFLGRLNVFNSELKAESDNLALACLSEARLQIAQGVSLPKSDTTTIDGETCGYDIKANGEIKIDAEVNDAFTYYHVKVDTDESDVPVNFFKECANLSPSFPCP